MNGWQKQKHFFLYTTNQSIIATVSKFYDCINFYLVDMLHKQFIVDKSTQLLLFSTLQYHHILPNDFYYLVFLYKIIFLLL